MSSTEPVYVSQGHRISLETSINIINACSNDFDSDPKQDRIPIPIRKVDLQTRDFIIDYEKNLKYETNPQKRLKYERSRSPATSGESKPIQLQKLSSNYSRQSQVSQISENENQNTKETPPRSQSRSLSRLRSRSRQNSRFVSL